MVLPLPQSKGHSGAGAKGHQGYGDLIYSTLSICSSELPSFVVTSKNSGISESLIQVTNKNRINVTFLVSVLQETTPGTAQNISTLDNSTEHRFPHFQHKHGLRTPAESLQPGWGIIIVITANISNWHMFRLLAHEEFKGPQAPGNPPS